MGRRGNPYDHAQAESFLFLEEVCHEKRLHAALGYVPPAEFERQLVQPHVA